MPFGVFFFCVVCYNLLAVSLRKGGVLDIKKSVTELKAKLKHPKKSSLTSKIKNVKPIHRAALIALLVMAVAIFAFGSSEQIVMYNDQQIVKIDSKKTYSDAIGIIKSAKEAELGMAIDEIKTGLVLNKKGKMSGEAVKDPAQLAEVLLPYVDFQATAAALQINGEPKVFLRSAEEANQLLEELRTDFVKEGEKVLSVAFREEVQVVKSHAAATRIMDLEEAKTFVLNGTDKLETYTVVKGDTLSTIAQKQGVALSALRAANPQINGDRLSIGQQLQLVKLEPLIHVMMEKEVVREEKIPFGTKTTNSADLWAGQTQVKKAGVSGLKEVTYKIVMENGREVEKQELNVMVLQEPQIQEVLRGTKLMVASRGGGDGQLAWPLRGNISSRYGPRGSGFHTGIDITGTRGTPLYSAGNGQVIFAGWGSGGYGNLVIIDHGNGLTTKYAHLTAFQVKVGQTVERGDVVGTVGSTGRSTGSHLHFETNVNGRHVDPMRYLGK